MNGAEKQAQFKARMRAKGLAQSNEWIPESKKLLFREMAAAWREGKDPSNVVTGNQSPEPEAIAEYYRRSRAKDPQTVLDRAVRAHVTAELEPQIEAEVQRRVVKERDELAELRKTLYRLQEEAQADRDRARELRTNLDGLMTEEEYRLVRGCLHPDRAPEDRRQQFGKAFDIFTRLEKSVNRDMPIKLRRQHGWA